MLETKHTCNTIASVAELLLSAGHAANQFHDLVGHLIKLGGHNELFVSVTIK